MYSICYQLSYYAAQQIPVHVLSNETIATVKAKTGIPPEAQLFHESVWLEDGHAIQRYCIEDEAVLHAELMQDVSLKCVGDIGNEIILIGFFYTEKTKDLQVVHRVATHY